VTGAEIVAIGQIAVKVGGFLLAGYDAVKKLIETTKVMTPEEFQARCNAEKTRLLGWLTSSDQNESSRFPPEDRS